MNKYMNEAINQAKKAYKKGEIPVGAVIVKDNKILSKAYNKREKKQQATKHAEIIAIEKACKKLKSWRLENCEIYVTLEPCPMCAGAICNARIKKLYFGAEEQTSKDNLLEKILNSTRLNHKVEIEKIESKQASELMSSFFKTKRKKTEK